MRWLFALIVAAVALVSGVSGRRFLGKEKDYDVVHGSVVVNMTTTVEDAYGRPMLSKREMQIPFSMKADKGKQVPQELHFQNEVDGGRSLKNVYKKMGLNKLADKIRHFKIKPPRPAGPPSAPPPSPAGDE